MPDLPIHTVSGQNADAPSRTGPGAARDGARWFSGLWLGALLVPLVAFALVAHMACCEIAADLPLARGERAEFETVIVNLVTNARDALPAGGAIRISAARGLHPAAGTDATEERLRVAVADTGVGMPPEVLARAGEPFFTTKAEGRGTGLGLAMARRFAEQDGGALEIASRPGEGTVVTLWLGAMGSPDPA